MRIPFGLSYVRIAAFAVSFALGGISGLATVAAQEFPGETATIRQLYPPSSVSKVDISLLQDALFDEECYGNLLTHKSEVDQDFGILTKKAMHAFVEAYSRSNVPNKRRLNSWIDVRTEADRKQRICSRLQVTVARLFTNSLTEHDPSKPRARQSQWLELHQNLYPNARNQIEIAQLQDSLFDNGCYGNRLTRENEVNKTFGANSKKALHVFVETYLNQPLRPSRNFVNAKEVLQAAQTNQSPCNKPRVFGPVFPWFSRPPGWRLVEFAESGGRQQMRASHRGKRVAEVQGGGIQGKL